MVEGSGRYEGREGRQCGDGIDMAGITALDVILPSLNSLMNNYINVIG